MGNSGRAELVGSAARHLDAPSPLVRAMAVWALGRLDPDRATLRAPAALRTETDPQVRAEWSAALASHPESAA
jgi:epoxyqueuosine reductase